jgi:hypothetical protein
VEKVFKDKEEEGMTRESQKIIEQKHLELFKSLFPEFPEGEVIPGENPDFLVHLDESKLGIEHTKIHKKPDKKNNKQSGQEKPREVLSQAYESSQNKIVAMAREIAESRGIPKTWVDIIFRKNTRLNNKDCPKLAQDIVRVIEETIDSEKCIRLDKSYDVKKENLPEEVLSIKFHLLEEDGPSFWRPFHSSGWGIIATAQLIKVIQAGIDSKKEKYKEYLENCSKCWLLLVAECKASSFIHPNEESLNHIYTSPFDRIYFLDCARIKLHPLKTKKEV